MFSDRLNRYIPLAVWAVALTTLLLIPFKIVSYGYLPEDDALRHAAKAVSGKPWSEILVMREDFPLDFHQGWHAILGSIHRSQNANTETLVVFSVVSLMLLVNFSALVWFRRPEAWLAALTAGCMAAPVMTSRLLLGRPFLFTMAVFMTLLLLWSKPDNDRPAAKSLLASILLIAAAAWIHGTSWYLLAFPAVALVLAGLWRRSVWFLGCWLSGALLGASLTGHPWQFVGQSLQLLFQAFGTTDLVRQLVTEFQPSSGDFGAILLAAAMVLWRSRTPGWSSQELLNPIFLMCIIGWLLGLKVIRFSVDWGLPAFLVWLALSFQEEFERFLSFNAWRRLWITLGLAVATFFSITSDLGSRWTYNLTNQYLTPEDPQIASWLPDKDGIIYNGDMRVFDYTFFKNPSAPWRYILGFEPGLMRPDDLAVLRKASWNFGDVRAYEPWIMKMRPEDRLILRASISHITRQPNLPPLEWFFTANDYWIGRLPRTNDTRSAVQSPK
jgi:hypothetical protein